MNLSDFNIIKKIFGDNVVTPEEQASLFNEVSLMTLARATSADTHTEQVEVVEVQEELRKLTGQTFTTAEIRVAAQSELFEETPLDKFLSKAGKKLEVLDRVRVVTALAHIIHADGESRDSEKTYFDAVAKALGIPVDIAAEIRAGL
ncbi:MAG: TerB family tellurite resistance protein [Pseudomonadales bacterium]